MTFAEKLGALRKAAGLTQAELASRSGQPAGTVRNYEQGIREPDWYGFLKLAEALGAGLEDFKDCQSKPKKPRGKFAGPVNNLPTGQPQETIKGPVNQLPTGQPAPVITGPKNQLPPSKNPKGKKGTGKK
jgi:transcriptional regulator with XRE-family HTH domain